VNASIQWHAIESSTMPCLVPQPLTSTAALYVCIYVCMYALEAPSLLGLIGYVRDWDSPWWLTDGG